MPENQDVLADRRFWAVVYAEMLGQIGPRPEPGLVYSLLGVPEREAQEWFDGIMGWSSGKSEEAPVSIRVSLGGGVDLSIEFRLGDEAWYLSGPDGASGGIASIGGHWELPGLRLEEVAAIANAAPGTAWVIVLLLLPVVWLSEGDDFADAQRGAAKAGPKWG